MPKQYSQRMQDTLRRTFGFRSLRPGQQQVIDSVMSGADTLAIMPTGAGKSLCYQLPALALPGQTLVISPLISLMRDQAVKLEEAGLEAAQLNSSIPADEQEQAMRDVAAEASEFIFATPERLREAAFMELLESRNIDLFVIDEAHCISQWGHDFRPAFLEIRAAIGRLGNPRVLALTATATPEVVEDIRRQLGRADMRVINTGIYRSNLRYSVISATNAQEKRDSLLRAVRSREGSGIVYAATVKAAEEAHGFLMEAGVAASLYHGRLAAKARHASQDSFMGGEARVMVATNAFGMGIDKQDIRFVIHYQLPPSLDAYYQESGRAGRDGNDADCVLIHEHSDKRIHQFFMGGRYPSGTEFNALWHAVQEQAAHGEDSEGIADMMALRAAVGGRGGLALTKMQVILNVFVEAGLLSGDAASGYRLTGETATLRAEALAAEYRKRSDRDRERLERMVFYAQTGFCRWEVLLQYFEETLPWAAEGKEEGGSQGCRHCDNCLQPKAAVIPVPQRRVPRARKPAFAAGERAQVSRYGEGSVVEAAGDTVTLEFADGEQRTFIRRAVKPVKAAARMAA